VLVLLAAASFAAGIAASRTSDVLVYLSIAFSLAAFVMLAIASLRARQARKDAPVDEFVAVPTRAVERTEAHAGPLLGGLDPTQLDMTPTWRRQGRRQPAADPVITDADEEDEDLEAQLENEEDEADFEVPAQPVAAGLGPDEFWWGRDDEDRQDDTAAFDVTLHEFEDDDSGLDVADPEPQPEEEDAEGSFYDQYDDLTAAEILPFLRALDLEGLEWVRDRERNGAKRATVVNQVEQLILDHGGRPAPSSTRKRSTTKRAAAKKASPAKRTANKSTRRR